MVSGRTLADWLHYQEQLHPVTIELGLERVSAVWQRLKLSCGDISSPTIVVGGTNGKGSTVAYIEQIYHRCGYSTVAYTSPHVMRYNERIRLDCTTVTDQLLIDAFEQVEAARGEHSLSYFEFGTLAALWIAAKYSPDVLLLEVGLGGRLDAVNILQHDVAIVTNVSMDHMEWLGYSLSAIAIEKAGIARPGKPLITADKDMPTSFYTAADRHDATVLRAGREFNVERNADSWSYISDVMQYRQMPMPGIKGAHQINNAACALTAIACLQERLPVNEACTRQALTETKLAGRFEQISASPPIYLDVAHNLAAARELHAILASLRHDGNIIAVMAMQSNRDISTFVQPLINDFAAWHVSPLACGMGHNVTDIETAISGLRADVPVVCHETVAAAIASAQGQLAGEGCMVIFGSFYTVSEACAALHV